MMEWPSQPDELFCSQNNQSSRPCFRLSPFPSGLSRRAPSLSRRRCYFRDQSAKRNAKLDRQGFFFRLPGSGCRHLACSSCFLRDIFARFMEMSSSQRCFGWKFLLAGRWSRPNLFSRLLNRISSANVNILQFSIYFQRSHGDQKYKSQLQLWPSRVGSFQPVKDKSLIIRILGGKKYPSIWEYSISEYATVSGLFVEIRNI